MIVYVIVIDDGDVGDSAPPTLDVIGIYVYMHAYVYLCIYTVCIICVYIYVVGCVSGSFC